ncbi:HAD-IC family P-type ATPase [Ancylobacter sp. Lp-2]|uniref:HAD-IC family P-type ATPase n=1 Tax=Ancylobacter sp. Lp-2 TaxID=2881339 RepID=UPI001E32B8A2|nr:HAD-IC family P-type ATPase [Ancylobacter sp. Lp-2]MCB4769876.1 HAD-IC family P-type ATPase [Ancylobacter sp. Lp-2]
MANATLPERAVAPPAVGPAPGTVERFWHALPHAEVARHLDVTADGLTAAEASARLARHGPNRLPEPPRRHPLLRFLAQFNNMLIYFLLAGALAASLIGHGIDAGVILAVVLANAIIGYVQEGKAEEALRAIREMISPHANVIRDGQRTSIGAHELVPGDVIVIEAGDRVPADARLMRARGMRIDESALTGESVAAEKHEGVAPEAASLGDRHSMAFSGTTVAAGQGAAVVVATGTHTEIGRIGTLMAEVEPMATPLLRQIDGFARRFTWVAFGGAALLFVFAVAFRNYDWADALIAVVALAVGVVPEGLPAVITITLAIGVRRMAARNAVIRLLPAVETLGATSVICSDKTGTLTRNEMTARRLFVPSGEIEVEGGGYRPEGAIGWATGTDAAEDAVSAALPLVRAGLLCNDAQLRHEAGHWSVEGDPMEGALVALAVKAGLDPAAERGAWVRRDEIPFDAAYRFMATAHEGPGGETAIFVKGAPEALLPLCSADPARWGAHVEAAAGHGERVLGFAAKRVAQLPERLSFDDVREGFDFLGLVGFIDPPRPEAVAAIAECRTAGIGVKMITGDHAATAAAIARQLGIAENPLAVTGAEVDAADDEELVGIARRTSVFARTSPENKLRIVRALQSTGAVVAMTGDGVNDAPSLRQADVGIAMGRKGTEAAKQAAEIVLVDDNFASIVAAVREGRTVYDNIRKMIAWTLPTNGGEVLCVIVAILAGLTMPMSPAQILWINLVLSATLGLALAFEPTEPGIMKRPPRPPGAGLLSPFMLWRIVFVSLLFLVAVLGLFEWSLARGDDVEMARTIVVNAIVVMEIFYLFNVRYIRGSSLTLVGVVGTRAVIAALAAVVVAQFAFTYLPLLQEIFATRPVSLPDGILIVGVGVALMIVLEIEKLVLRRLGLFAAEKI